MSNVAENRIALFEEVEELRQKKKKHFADLSKAENAQRIAESKLEDAKRAIKVNEDNLKAERVEGAEIRAEMALEEAEEGDGEDDGTETSQAAEASQAATAEVVTDLPPSS